MDAHNIHSQIINKTHAINKRNNNIHTIVASSCNSQFYPTHPFLSSFCSSHAEHVIRAYVHFNKISNCWGSEKLMSVNVEVNYFSIDSTTSSWKKKKKNGSTYNVFHVGPFFFKFALYKKHSSIMLHMNSAITFFFRCEWNWQYENERNTSHIYYPVGQRKRN